MKTKVCSLCHNPKPEECFYQKWESKDGYAAMCKECQEKTDFTNKPKSHIIRLTDLDIERINNQVKQLPKDEKYEFVPFVVRRDYGTVGRKPQWYDGMVRDEKIITERKTFKSKIK